MLFRSLRPGPNSSVDHGVEIRNSDDERVPNQGAKPRERQVSPPSPTSQIWVTTPHAGDSRSTEASGMRMNRPRTPPAALPARRRLAVAMVGRRTRAIGTAAAPRRRPPRPRRGRPRGIRGDRPRARRHPGPSPEGRGRPDDDDRRPTLSVRIRDIDTGRATLWLREKNDTEREQPASPSLVALVLAHAADRGGSDAGDRVYRSRQGEPITGRRYDRLFARARESLDWDGRLPVSAHVLRHTAITRIGRIAGYPVAQAFAGHAPPSVTGRYLHASVADVATAVAALTGEDHPLAHPGRDSIRRSCADPRR